MKKTNFESQLSSRLLENKKLYEQPGLFGKLSMVGSMVGLYGFWILLTLSLMMSVWFVSNEHNQPFNEILFGLLYE